MAMILSRMATTRGWTHVAALALLAILAVLVVLRPAHTNPVVRTIVLDQSPTAMVVDPDTGRLFISTSALGEQGRVAVLDTRTAALVRTVPAGYQPRGMAIDERTGHVFVANADTSMTVLDARTGRVVRSVALGVIPMAVAVDALTSRVFVAGMALGWNGHAIAMADGPGDVGSVSVFDTRDASLVRTVLVGRDPSSLVVDARGGHVFVLNRGSASVSVLDARSGRLLRTVADGGDPSAAGEANGRAFITTDVTAHRAADVTGGVVVHTVAAGQHPGPSGTDRHRRLALVVNRGSRTVSVRDAGTGALRDAVPVGVNPEAVVVDERSEFAFVLNAGGMARVRQPWWGRLARLLRPWLPWFAPRAVFTHAGPASVSVLDLAQV